jgi:oxygen-dependent protoporphyrinogen oxidase
MGILIARLVERLEELGATLVLKSRAEVPPEGFDHVIVATEAHNAARLLQAISPSASELLADIQHASVAQVTIEIPVGQLEPLDASGILVPRSHGFVMTACTWFSTKWAQYRSEDRYLIRITSGRFGDDRAIRMNDEELSETLIGEFSTVYDDPGEPLSKRIVRWPLAFPQYQPGHSQRVDSIEAALAADAPTVHLVGNSYRGIGIPSTIGLARRTASAITA